MVKTGEKLKNARLLKGISLEEAQKKTRIHLNILKALEEDSSISLSPVYRKGFLKIYCEFLGIDINEVLKPEQDKPQPQDMRVDAQFKQPGYSLRQVISRMIAGLQPYITPKIILRAALVIFILIVALKLPRIVSNFKYGLSHRRQQISARQRAGKAKKLKTEASSKNKQTIYTTGTQPQASQVKAASPISASSSVKPEPALQVINLAMRARGDSWVQVKVDGKTVFQNVLKKNKSETWQAKAKIELSIGNAGVIDLEVNGKPISDLGRRGQSLKNVVITREGLQVLK